MSVSIIGYDITVHGEDENGQYRGLKARFNLQGKSTDTKPQKLIGMDVDNMSSFFEANTHKLYKYDEDTHQWITKS